MLDRIRGLIHGQATLSKDVHGEEASSELKLAVAIILLELAMGDEEFAVQEKLVVRNEISKAFGLNRLEAQELLDDASEYPPEMLSVTPWIKMVASKFSEAQRKEVFKLVWKVIRADGVVERYEQALADSIAKEFGISDEECMEFSK